MTNYARLGIREVTEAEMKVFNMIEDYMLTLSDEEAEWLTEVTSDFVFSSGLDRRTCYDRLFRYIRRNNLNFRPSDLETWYCID